MQAILDIYTVHYSFIRASPPFMKQLPESLAVQSSRD